MLSPRADGVLKSIIGQYITRAVPVPSQSLTGEFELEISSATIRNEVARLEQEGYVTRPHLSAGSIPSDKGYRYYVESLREIELPMPEKRLISHIFHQVEEELEEWLRLSATLIARMVGNMVVVSLPKSSNCHLKLVELVTLQDSLALMVLILHGARLREQLVNFDQIISQTELSAMAEKLNGHFNGLTSQQILAKKAEFSPLEQQMVDTVVKTMQAEDEQEYHEPYLDGLHLMLSQPEFTMSRQVQGLLELIEHRVLLKAIVPPQQTGEGTRVIIGRENKTEMFRDYSVVIGRYGLRGGAVGNLAVVGPTRMAYAHAIAAVNYMTSVLSELVAELYGKEKNEALGQDKNG